MVGGEGKRGPRMVGTSSKRKKKRIGGSLFKVERRKVMREEQKRATKIFKARTPKIKARQKKKTPKKKKKHRFWRKELGTYFLQGAAGTLLQGVKGDGTSSG